MRKFIFAGNWKMYKTLSETKEYFEKFLTLLKGLNTSDREVVIAPPFTALAYSRKLTDGSFVKLAAQNCCWEEKGAFTGEISPVMLKELEVEYVIIGHSERRHIFGEKDEIIAKRVRGAYTFGLIPIFCVGETFEERKAEKTFEIVERQLKEGLKFLDTLSGEDLVIAYEPVWAIGTGINATPEQAEEVHSFIRGKLEERYGKEVSNKVRILYGGSVSPENVKDLLSKPNVDGVLVGGASLDPEKFFKICSVESFKI